MLKTGITRAAVLVLLWAALTSAAQAQQWRNDKGVVVVVGMPFVELYVFPGQGFPRFHALEKHEQLRLFKRRAGWYKVETEDGKLGWVKRSDLTHVYDLDGQLLDFSTPGWSDPDYPWQLGLMASQFDNVLAYSVYAGRRLTRNISAEIKYTQAFGDASNIKMGSLMLVHQTFPGWRASPFFTLGAGIMQTFPDSVLVEAEDRQDTAITVGGGLLIHLNHKVTARLEYNQHLILTTRENNQEVEEWKAGFSVLF